MHHTQQLTGSLSSTTAARASRISTQRSLSVCVLIVYTPTDPSVCMQQSRHRYLLACFWGWIPDGIDGGHGALLSGEKRLRDPCEVRETDTVTSTPQGNNQRPPSTIIVLVVADERAVRAMNELKKASWKRRHSLLLLPPVPTCRRDFSDFPPS